jgi:hypothetical protein
LRRGEGRKYNGCEKDKQSERERETDAAQLSNGALRTFPEQTKIALGTKRSVYPAPNVNNPYVTLNV